MHAWENRELKNIILIFSIALILRLFLFVSVAPWQEGVEKEIILKFDDAPGYHNMAVHLAQGKPFNKVYDRALYQYLIVALYSIFGYKPYIVIIFQLIMGALTCVFLYKIIQKIAPENFALFGGLFLAFEYSSILYTNHLLSETMFTFIFIISTSFLMKFLMDNDNKALIYSAIFLGLSTHIRSIGLYFLIFLIPVFLLYFRDNLKKGILLFSIFLLVFFIMIVPWMVRNYVVAGEFVLSPDQGRAKYWFFPNIMNIVMPPQKIRYFIDKEGKTHYIGYFDREIQPENIPKTKRYIRAFFADIRSNITGAYRFLFTVNSGGYPEILGYSVHKLSEERWKDGLLKMTRFVLTQKTPLELFFLFLGGTTLLFLYSMGLYGIYISIIEREIKKVILFITIILYFLMASSGPNATEVINPRHKIPIIPYLIALSCYGLTKFIYRRYNKKSNHYIKKP